MTFEYDDHRDDESSTQREERREISYRVSASRSARYCKHRKGPAISAGMHNRRNKHWSW